MKRVRVYACLTGKLQPCSARGQQQDWAVCSPIYVIAVGVDVVPAKAPMLVFVAGCISVLCVCVCACVCLVLGKCIALAAVWTYQWQHQSLYLLNGRNPLSLEEHGI